MNQNKMELITTKHIWRMSWCVFILSCLLVWLFADYQSQVFTLGWWIVLICLSGAIVTGLVYIGYSYLIYYIHEHTENNNG